MVFNNIFGYSSNKIETKEVVVESKKGNGGTWYEYITAPVSYLSHNYYLNRSSNSETKNKPAADSDESIGNELVNANRGLSAAILVPWRQYVVAPAKYLSTSTQFAVLDKVNMKWLFRLDKAHGKGATYPHVNVNPALTGVRDPHTRVPGALVNASGPAGKVMRNAGDIATIAAIGIDTYQIGAAAHKELKEKGGIGVETGKVAGGVTGAWTLGFLGAAVGGKVGAVAGGIILGPVGAGVFGIFGAVAGGVGGSIKGRGVGENLAEDAAVRLAEHHKQNKCKL